MSRWSGRRSVFPGEEYGVCGTCGRTVPQHSMVLTRRYGWQCTGWPGANCYDGAVQRDEIIYVPRPGEGARLSAMPAQSGDEGVDNTAELLFRRSLVDAVDGTIWNVAFAVPITFTSSSDPPRANEAFSLTSPSGWGFWIASGLGQFGEIPSTLTPVPLPEGVALDVIGGVLVATT